MKIVLNQKILSLNEHYAAQNRQYFQENRILCLNVISSPGSGKTTLLARTVADLKDRFAIGVIEGDIRTDLDAQRIRAAGADAVQIQTEGACHLSAQQVGGALKLLANPLKDILFIENVGNLVCPSAFDLGEAGKVVMLSVPEGDDKPIKYPATFASADVIILNKIDLLNVIAFNLKRIETDIRKVNPQAAILQLSAAKGEGMAAWYEWLAKRLEQFRKDKK